MNKLTYKEQLLHPNWQRKRLECLQRAGWTCQRCLSTDKTLHVHHKVYFKGRMPWEYEAQELIVLCDQCHEDEHELQDDLKRAISLSWHRPEVLAEAIDGMSLQIAGSVTEVVSGLLRIEEQGEARAFMGARMDMLDGDGLLAVARFIDSLIEKEVRGHA